VVQVEGQHGVSTNCSTASSPLLVCLFFPASQGVVEPQDFHEQTQLSPFGGGRTKAVNQFHEETICVNGKCKNKDNRIRGACLVEELVEKLDVDEHRRCISQLVCYHVQEGFWAEHFALRASATSLGLESHDTEFKYAQAIVVHHCISRCQMNMSMKK